MFGKNWNQRRLGLESLEPRQMLAGNVTAQINVDGNVVLTGDLADNHVAIYRGTFGQIVVEGGTSSGDATGMTRVNGLTRAVTFNTNGGIIFNMRAGNDRVLITNINVSGNISGSMGLGDDQFVMQSSPAGAVPFIMNNGRVPPYGKVAARGLVSVAGSDGNDTFSLYNATISGPVTFNGGNGNDLFVQSGTTHSQNIIGGNFRIEGGSGDDVIDLRRLAVGANLFITDGDAILGSTVTLTNLRVSLDIEIYLSIFSDLVRIQGEDAGANRFQARNVILFTGDSRDDVLIDRGVMVNLTVDTGAGDEGNGYFGVTIADLVIDNRFYLDLGAGFDNAFLDNIAVDFLEVYGRSGSDGIIAQNITALDAVFDSDTFNDVIGLYDSFYRTLDIFLFDGNDQLFAGGLSVSNRARFNGGFGVNTYRDLGGNFYERLERINI